MAVIPLPYKKPEVASGSCIRISFHSGVHKTLDGKERTVNMSVLISIPEYEEVINGIKEAGGFWGMGEVEGQAFFVPWPPACVEVSVIPDPGPSKTSTESGNSQPQVFAGRSHAHSQQGTAPEKPAFASLRRLFR